ncbi:MAG TPA: hypothetical protein VK735_26675 [Pseudonocardia sp.]|jgi:hypothetical protein|uniref:hypothetical protein n=1 Tax=Pseudonocardia sp. TaxID=60912 RepID=UPI002BD14B90|nr:hypothetical protein [Pseudonocardia sp.]HTF51045.1 hypothetical protein [Pseudonocardia sp.]
MQRVVRATVASVIAASAALLIGAGTANAATPASEPAVAAATQTNDQVLALSVDLGLGDALDAGLAAVNALLGALGITL